MGGLEVVENKENDVVEVHDYTTSISGVGLLTVLLLTLRVTGVIFIPWYFIILPVIINFLIQIMFEFIGFVGFRKELIEELEQLKNINATGLSMITLMKIHLKDFEDGE